MTTNTDTKRLTEAQRSELSRMLSEAAIDPATSILLKGETLWAAVSVWPSEIRGGHFDILLTAFEPESGRLSLEGVSLTASGATDDDMFLSVARETPRGDLAMKDLRSDARYSLHVRAEVAAPHGEPVVLHMPATAANPQATERFVPAPQLGRLEAHDPPLNYAVAAAADEPHVAQPTAPTHQLYHSDGGRLRATLRHEPDGRTLVAVETSEPALAGARVRFTFVDKSGRAYTFTDESGDEHKSGEVELKQVVEDVWEGRSYVHLAISDHCTFLFETL